MDLSPEGVAQSKRAHMASITDQDWQLWRHNSITAGFLQYLDDQIATLREAAADLLEAGAFVDRSRHQDANPDALRGQIIMLRQIHGLTLGHVTDFYAQGGDNEGE